MNTIKIFLASSSELEEDRREFEIFIGRKNKEYTKRQIFLELVIWEDFIDAMSKTRLQDEYNKSITESDIFIVLLHTKIGRYTEEEFFKAYESFSKNGKPLIYTYFKDASVNISSINKNILSLLNFKEKLGELGHYCTNYKDMNELKYQFGEQLTKIESSSFDFEEESKFKEVLSPIKVRLDVKNTQIIKHENETFITSQEEGFPSILISVENLGNESITITSPTVSFKRTVMLHNGAQSIKAVSPQDDFKIPINGEKDFLLVNAGIEYVITSAFLAENIKEIFVEDKYKRKFFVDKNIVIEISNSLKAKYNSENLRKEFEEYHSYSAKIFDAFKEE